ncbi:MAG: MBL fold metallo-hydrolase [Gammaproteobacteria bacterium]|nr:MBL fold metallo-hydrolase [Gammaproteobacteria bacterium]
MKVTLRGVRGSIPVPGPDTVHYGGNTTCIEVLTDAGDLIILDGGSGIRQLGNELLAKMPIKASIFISHTHWDHIQGLPFFVPLFIPGNEFKIYGAFDPVYGKDLKSILSQQMEYCYFPVRENELKSQIEYTNLRERETIEVGSAKVTCLMMNHPVLNYGYLVEADGKRLFFTGDHEPQINIYDPEDEEYAEFQEMIDTKEQIIGDFINGADLLITDCMYTEEEYPAKVGWGHGTITTSVAMATRAKAKKLVLTHHDPIRTDAQLDEIFKSLALRDDIPEGLEIEIAREGITYAL